jgi:hypothetical protein
MLFLLHKLSKMAQQGSKIALIFNGSPLFNGDAGRGPSNIRRLSLPKTPSVRILGAGSRIV